MVLIIISWCYILLTSVHLGIAADKVMRLKSNDFVIVTLLGLVTTTLLASIWAIFGRINIEFHLALLLSNFFIFIGYKTLISSIYSNLMAEIRNLKTSVKVLLFFIGILIVAQCAAAPFVIDNETYYVQTIKWLNEYGFVKGLANLHIFLGQTSGWHITQSAFSFSFLYPNFNDLSGFCLLLGNYFSLRKLNAYLETRNTTHLILGLFVVFNPLLFQFISAPSPDIAVFVVSYVLFFLFLENFEKPTSEIIRFTFLLSMFLIYIKPTSIVVLAIPIAFVLLNYKTLRISWYPILGTGALFLFLFVMKNTIITGYPLYPTQIIGGLPFDFVVPQELISFYFDEAKLYGFFMTKAEFHQMNVCQIMLEWLSVAKINGAFNILSIVLVTTVPFFIYKYSPKKAIWVLYCVMLLQLVVLLMTSPQFRFFLNFIIFFVCFMVACIFKTRKKSVCFFVYASTLAAFILVFVPVNISSFTQNKLFTTTSNFRLANLVLPSDNSNLKTYTSNKLGNLTYYSPGRKSYFWYGGNGKLPCVNKQQLDYFKTNFNFIPQKRTSNLKDGFYSKKLFSDD